MSAQPELVEAISFSESGRRFANRGDMYNISEFTEFSNPDMTDVARKVHAEGYCTMNFVEDSAIDPATGWLAEDIDKARGPYVDIFVAENPANEKDKATIRKEHIPYGGTVDDLPAIQLCRGSMRPEVMEMLDAIESPEFVLKEIGAMARTEAGGALGPFELIRETTQAARGKGELWIFSIVSTTFDSLQESFGERAFPQVGEPVDLDDDRVKEHIKLIPVLVDIDNFYANIAEGAITAGNPVRAKKLIRSFLFLTAGMEDTELTPKELAFKEAVLQGKRHIGAAS